MRALLYVQIDGSNMKHYFPPITLRPLKGMQELPLEMLPLGAKQASTLGPTQVKLKTSEASTTSA